MSLSSGTFDSVFSHGSTESFPSSLTLKPSFGRTVSLLVLAFVPLVGVVLVLRLRQAPELADPGVPHR